MALVVRHEYQTPLSEFDLGTDQNRFEVGEYPDGTLNVLALSQSVCTIVDASQIVDKNDLKYKDKKYEQQPEDAVGPGSLVLQPLYKTYEDRIWAGLEMETETKCKKLLLNLTSEDPEKKGPEYQRVKTLPWPRRGTHHFAGRFANQPTYGSATGFMVGPGIVATAAHAIHMSADGPEIDNCKVVFNLRKTGTVSNNNNNSSGSSSSPAGQYSFDMVYDIERVICHSAPKIPDKSAKKYGSIRDFFRYENWVSLEHGPNPNHDLCILQLKPIVKNETPQAWVAPLTVSNEPLSRVDEEPSGDYFVIGSPHGLPLKISGRGTDKRIPKLSKPKILKPVDGFFANFTCDVDCLGGNSGGPILYRGKDNKISVVGLVRGGRREDWGLSSQGYEDFQEGGSSNDPLQAASGTLVSQGRAWVNEKVQTAQTTGPIYNPDNTSLALDKRFFTSFTDVSFYEKQKTIDIRRFSEYHPIWKNSSLFNRADFINQLASGMDPWYRSNRAVSLRVELTVQGTSQQAGQQPINFTAILKRESLNRLIRWTTLQINPQTASAICRTPPEKGKFRADLCWTRSYDARDYDGTAELPIQDGIVGLNTGAYIGDIDPSTFTHNSCIAEWKYLAIMASPAPAVPQDLSLLGGQMVLSFTHPGMVGSMELTKKLTFAPVENKIGVFACQFSDEPWCGPTAMLPAAVSVATPSMKTRQGATVNDGISRERRTVYQDPDPKDVDAVPYMYDDRDVTFDLRGMDEPITMSTEELTALFASLDMLPPLPIQPNSTSSGNPTVSTAKPAAKSTDSAATGSKQK